MTNNHKTHRDAGMTRLLTVLRRLGLGPRENKDALANNSAVTVIIEELDWDLLIVVTKAVEDDALNDRVVLEIWSSASEDDALFLTVQWRDPLSAGEIADAIDRVLAARSTGTAS